MNITRQFGSHFAKKLLTIMAVVVAASLPFLFMMHTVEAGKTVFGKGDQDELERAKQISLEILSRQTLDRNTGTGNDLKVEKVEIDDLRMAHTRVRQTVGDIPVWEGEAIVHLKFDGSLFVITDNLKESIEVNTEPNLSADEAVRIAHSLYKGTAKETKRPKVSMWIYQGKDRDHLTYRVEIPRIDGSKDTAIPVDFIDAQTGERVFGYDNLQTGTGSSLYSGTVTIGTSRVGSTYYMENPTRKIGTFNFNNGEVFSTATRFTDTDDIWNSTVQRAGVDAQYGAETVMSYYQTVHNRNGLDGSGGPGYTTAAVSNSIGLISSMVHYGSNYNNAFWNGDYVSFGDGDGTMSTPWATLDMSGHEMTHGVTQYSADLTYAGESGALNESMSDVFGTMIERYARPTTWNWKIFEDAWTPGTPGDAIRHLDNPRARNDPDHYSLRLYPGPCTPSGEPGGNDNCGVHTNSGISNHAFYLIAAGGTNRVSGITVPGIGADNAAKIWYKALTTYMTEGTNFLGARTATLNAATALFGASSSQYNSVAMGWCAVGVGSCSGGGTCTATSISPGQTVNGSLTTSDCVFTGTTRYVDVYNFSGTAGQRIAVSMNSSAFDTYLYLKNSGNQTLAENDDSGGGTNSRIPMTSGFFTLPANGTYSIYATSYSAGLTGAYSLNLVSEVVCSYSISPTSQSISAAGGNSSVNVTTQNGCNWSAASNAAWIILTSGTSGSSSGTVGFSVAANTSNSPRTGTITIAGQTFTVNQSAGTTGCSAPSAIAFGQSVNGNLQSGDCLYSDNSFYDAYTFNGTAGQQIYVALNSTQFNAYLLLYQGNYPGGTLLIEDNNGNGGTNARIPATSGFMTLPVTGTYTILANSFVAGESGNYTLYLGTNIIPTSKKPFDFDGDGKADISVFRPSNGAWYINQSQAGLTGVSFGLSSDKIVPADYDGDGKTDVAVYRGGIWYLQRSQLGFTELSFGDANDVPVPADYDGDGKADIAVFRPSNGVWYLLRSQLGFIGVSFGRLGDKPVAADYDGDGKADIAVYRAGTWYLQRSQLGFTEIAFGDGNDKPVPADYDGDGKADVSIFRPSNGVWYLNRSQLGFTGVQFGIGTDSPAAADYDGDGKTDVAIFRNGIWYIQRSQMGFIGLNFGSNLDKPIPNAFVP